MPTYSANLVSIGGTRQVNKYDCPKFKKKGTRKNDFFLLLYKLERIKISTKRDNLQCYSLP